MTETARALNDARQSCADGRPDDPVEISAIALAQLGRTVTTQQGEIESLSLDVDEMRRRLQTMQDINAVQIDGLSSGLKTELMLLRHTLLRIGNEEWFASEHDVVMADSAHGKVAKARSEVVAQYIACVDPRLMRALLAELARRRGTVETPKDGA